MKTPDLKSCPFCGGEPLLMQKENICWYMVMRFPPPEESP